MLLKVSVKILRCSWLNIWDLTEEALQELGPGAGMIRWSDLTLMGDLVYHIKNKKGVRPEHMTWLQCIVVNVVVCCDLQAAQYILYAITDI